MKETVDGLRDRTGGQDPAQGRAGWSRSHWTREQAARPTAGTRSLRQDLLSVHPQQLLWQPLSSSKVAGLGQPGAQEARPLPGTRVASTALHLSLEAPSGGAATHFGECGRALGTQQGQKKWL